MRVVSDGHIPVVARDEVLAESISNIINNSAELKSAGVDPATIKTDRAIDAVLLRASDYIKSNLEPRAGATISFGAQRQLAADHGMTVEELLSCGEGQAFNYRIGFSSPRAARNYSWVNTTSSRRASAAKSTWKPNSGARRGIWVLRW